VNTYLRNPTCLHNHGHIGVHDCAEAVRDDDGGACAHEIGEALLRKPPSFASKWLLPRLERFKALQPEVEVWVSAEMRLVDFSNADIDIAIRYGAGAYEGLISGKTSK